MTEESHWPPEAGDYGSEPACSCTTESFATPGGEIVVLRVVGEIDVASLGFLRARLDAVLCGTRHHLVVDFAAVSFCSVRGFAVLAATADLATALGIGYALVLPTVLARYWAMLPFAEIQLYHSVAQAVVNIRADQAMGDLA